MPTLSIALREADEIEMTVALRVAEENPVKYLTHVKRHIALSACRDVDYRIAYERLDTIQGAIAGRLTDLCVTPRADGEPCGRLEGEHMHDNSCPTYDWYDVTRKFRKAA
jgi:hypothetical protein